MNETKNIANIVNFVRAVEPREKDNSYLPETTKKELELCRRYGFKSTVLLQYDALILPEYRDILSSFSDITEIGIWFEVVQPLVEDCGLEWHGRFSWDWHNDVGFLVGYDTEDRKLLIDRFFEVFKEYYGVYPKAVGSWHIDAFSPRYMSEKYGISVSCNCKDQYGTDGYKIWGGCYAGAYYPSVNNMICPANSPENQINVPVFRMLGSDLFQGIPGIDLDKRKSEYVRKNIVPTFISERAPGNNREELWKLLEDCDMQYLNQLEWLTKTDTHYVGDRLCVRKTTLLYESDITFNKLKRTVDIQKRLLEYICAGRSFGYKGFKIDDMLCNTFGAVLGTIAFGLCVKNSPIE